MVYVILVYDINVERLGKVLKTCRVYLNWVQNSVFEGEITEANLRRLKEMLREIIDEDEDSILIYRLPSEKFLKKEVLGREKAPTDFII